jgi:hypothetical protein
MILQDATAYKRLMAFSRSLRRTWQSLLQNRPPVEKHCTGVEIDACREGPGGPYLGVIRTSSRIGSGILTPPNTAMCYVVSTAPPLGVYKQRTAMNLVQLLGSTLGIGFVAGVRLYATILAMGLGIRFHWFQLSAGQEHLRVLAEPLVIAVSGAACLIEFVSDKIPWVDSLWDSFHTVIRPVGAAMLAAASLGSVDPAVRMCIVIACGGVALTSHSSKASTRLLVNHSPEPFSNIALSILEDLFTPVGLWLALKHPIVALTLVLIFLAGFAWLSPKVFRLMRLQVVALLAWIQRGRRTPGNRFDGAVGSFAVPPLVSDALAVISRNASPIPQAYAAFALAPSTATTSLTGIRCAATKTVRNLGNSVGYLAVMNEEVAFVTRRLFKYRVHRILLREITHVEWKRGLLMNRLLVRTASAESVFYVFKDVEIGAPMAHRGHT